MVKTANSRYRTLLLVVVFVVLWTQHRHLGDFIEGLFQGYEENQATHRAD